MRLLDVCPFLPYPLDNGGAIGVYHLLRDLARRHRVVLVCSGVLTREALDARATGTGIPAKLPPVPAGIN